MSRPLYTVFTKSNCSFCTKVKELLKNEQYEEVNCDHILATNKEQFLADIKQRIGREYKTFPMVFLNDQSSTFGTFIGGYTDSVAHFEFLSAFNEP